MAFPSCLPINSNWSASASGQFRWVYVNSKTSCSFISIAAGFNPRRSVRQRKRSELRDGLFHVGGGIQRFSRDSKFVDRTTPPRIETRGYSQLRTPPQNHDKHYECCHDHHDPNHHRVPTL